MENASLVPWLTLVGAGHLMLVNKRKPTALFSLYLLTMTLHPDPYSTFLTRSGVLAIPAYTASPAMACCPACCSSCSSTSP
ncbi:MAG: hypothetical protein IPF64_12500 [Flavobacteriales bacterium]|nr:hypothetical protein [Flavobacteriales bacterium]